MEPVGSQYKIGGCTVLFPHKAYGTQLSFMSKVITALEQGTNALLEAPTGSGKTLSLLCASLAWQEREKRRIEEGILASRGCVQNFEEAQALSPTPDPNFCVGITDQSPSPPPAHSPIKGNSGPEFPSEPSWQGGFLPGSTPLPGQTSFKRPPKIFYATRTHSQISQVVRELKRSGYNPRMVVLAAKSHYCVNPKAKQHRNLSIDEACEELLKNSAEDSGCSFFKGVRNMQHSTEAWKIHDIEDLAAWGKSRVACPYYVSRVWASDADVIFGPYSYIIDPVIRRSMGVDVENSVVIFDEAHNIEDVSREAASLDATLTELEEAHHAFGRVVQYHNDVLSGPCVYSPLHSASGAVLQWLERQQVLTQSQGSYYERIWQGPPLLGELKAMDLTAEAVVALWDAYLAAREEDEASRNSRPLRNTKNKTTSNLGDEQLDGRQQEGLPVLLRVGAAALGFMSRLIQIVRMLHEVSNDGGRDYRLVFRRQRTIRSSNSPNQRYKRRRSQREGEDGAGGVTTVTVSFSLWCLNPSIAFRQISNPAHSILLTSGTLAPLDSFASELGAAFPIRLEAPHVVNMRTQVWAGVVGQGVPGNAGAPLIATYQHADGYAFQDSLGLVVLEMCRCIPDGVLLFMPSYGMMEKVSLRWKATGLWLRLGQCKSQIVVEPRTGGADALGEAMGTYYGAVSTGGGALLIAVCRGKVSEGLDFTDENARGVLLVGIPFPNIKDSKVEAKRKFNDALSGSNHVNGANAVMPQLLSGSLWYEQQAFRALNQAIGRCIRHKGDWGAIVLVDDRFRQPRYQKGLSRWVRGALVAPPTFESAIESLKLFFQSFAKRSVTCQSESLGKPDGLCNDLSKEKATKETKDAFALMMNKHSHKQDIVGPLEQRIKERMQLIEDWVRDEIRIWSQWVWDRKAAASMSQAKEVAMLGLLDTFALAREVSFPHGTSTGRHDWLTTVKVPPPRVLQAFLYMMPPQVLPPDFTVAPEAQELASELLHVCGGGWTQDRYSLVLAVMESEYSTILQRIGGMREGEPLRY